MNRCFDPYSFIDVVNKLYGAVCQGLDSNLLGNCVINLCIYSDPVQQYALLGETYQVVLDNPDDDPTTYE